MSELKQIAAGRKGKGGPKTEAGKHAASRNATKHGLHARTLEAFAPADRADFEDVLNEYTAHYKPKDLTERELVHQLAFNRFRYYRFLRFQEAAFSDSPDDRFNLAEIENHTRTHQYFERTLTQLDRAYHRTLRLLDDRRKHALEREATLVEVGIDLATQRIEYTSDATLKRLMKNAETNSQPGRNLILFRALKPKTPGGWHDYPHAA